MMCPMLAHSRGKFEPKTDGYIDTILRFSISFIYKYIYSNLIVNYIFIYKQKVVENQCFIIGFCFIDLPENESCLT